MRCHSYIGPFDKTTRWLGYFISSFNNLQEPQAQEDWPPHVWVRLETKFQSCDGKLPRLSDRVLDMYLHQPPVTSADFVLSCCELRHYAANGADVPAREIERADGGFLKIRDIYDVAADLFEKHKLCPDASTEMLGSEGFVRNTLMFWCEFWDHGEKIVQPLPGGRVEWIYGDISDDACSRAAWAPHIEGTRIRKEWQARGRRIRWRRKMVCSP